MSENSNLRWLCRRGMKELDVLMTGYLDFYFDEADERERQSFRYLLEMEDADLFALLVGRASVDDEAIGRLVEVLKNMVKQRF